MNHEIGNAQSNATPLRKHEGGRITPRDVLHNKNIQRIAALLIFVGVGGAVFFVWQQVHSSIFHDPETLITIRYPEPVVRAAITDEDKKAKVIFRANESEKETATPFLLTVRYEEGLRKVSSMLRYDILDILTDNVDKLFPSQYPKFEKSEEKKYSLNGKKTAEIVFTYLSPVGEEVMQRFVIVMRDEDMAIYITVQAKKKDFVMLNKKYFEKIISSLQFQLK